MKKRTIMAAIILIASAVIAAALLTGAHRPAPYGLKITAIAKK